MWKGDGAHVMIFGDSITYRLEHGPGLDRTNQYTLLTDHLVVTGHSASVSAMIGAVTNGLDSVAQYVPAPGADILLIALGTNDMHVNTSTGTSYFTVEEAVANLSNAIDTIGAPCTILVTIAETEPWGLDVTGPAFNRALRAMPDVRIADWAPVVEADPGLVVSDGVHLTDAGVAAYTALFDDAISTCP